VVSFLLASASGWRSGVEVWLWLIDERSSLLSVVQPRFRV